MRNRRVLKICNLCRLGMHQFETDKSNGLQTFKTALQESELLHDTLSRDYYVFVCSMNTSVACIAIGHYEEGVQMLRDIIPITIETHLEEIWYYIGIGMLFGNLEDKATIKQAFTNSRSFFRARPSDDVYASPYIISTMEMLIELEDDTTARIQLIHLLLDMKTRLGTVSLNDILKLKISLINVLLVQDPFKAKQEIKSMLNLEQLLPESDEKSMRSVQASTWCDLGLIYSQVQDFVYALQCFRYPLVRRELTVSKEEVFTFMLNVLAIYMFKEDFRAAVPETEGHVIPASSIIHYSDRCLSEETMELLASVRNKHLVIQQYLNFAYSYLRLVQADQAFQWYTKALQLQLEIGSLEDIPLCLDGLLAALIIKDGNPRKSLEEYKLKMGTLEWQMHEYRNGDLSEYVAKVQKTIFKEYQQLGGDVEDEENDVESIYMYA